MVRGLSTVLIGIAPVVFGERAHAAFPRLSAVVEAARAKGPAVVLAGADLSVASSTRHAAGLAPLTNPYVEVRADRGKFTEDLAVSASVYLPIELSGQRSARIAEVDALVRWKQASRTAATASAIGEAVEAYGDVLVTGARLNEAAEGEKVAREESAYVEGRLARGDATVVDEALAEGEVARWLQSKSEAEVAMSLARARLAVALGDSLVDAPGEDDSPELPPLHVPSADALVAQVETTSPVIAAPGREADFFTASRERFDAEKYPPLNVVVLGGRGDLGEARFGGGLAWTLPLLRYNQAEIARADAEASRALATRAVVTREALARARGLYVAYQATHGALAEFDRSALPAAAALVDASLRAWKVGKLDLQRVFLARRDLAAAHGRRLDLIATGWRMYSGLAGLVGGLP
jgi:cobalt-zinc-cadmium efflux system outer membrane protein